MREATMDPFMHQLFQKLAEKHKLQPPFLEIGAAPGANSIISAPYFVDKTPRVAINLNDFGQSDGITFIKANSNDLSQHFRDGEFNTVISNAVLEHDRYFWKSVAEMHRVLAPGGFLVVAAPGFIRRKQLEADIAWPDDMKFATVTFDVHASPDYWRFSKQAFKNVICDGLELIELRSVMSIPRVIAVARKPLAGTEPEPSIEE
jgi:SAM-dependent methyltransferase